MRPALILAVSAALGPLCAAQQWTGAGGSHGSRGLYSWDPIGPRGGFISAVAFHPGLPGTLLVSGDDSSGLYRSSDDGVNWQLVRDTPTEASVYGFAFDPTDPDVVYGYSHFGRGVLASIDGGRSWADRSLGLPYERLVDLVIDSTDHLHLFAATEQELFESFDGGLTWNGIPPGAPAAQFTALAQPPGTPGVLFLGTFEPGGNGGLYTYSAGQWQVVASFPVSTSDLAFSPNALYASTASGSIYSADLQGQAWSQIARGSEDVAPDIPSLLWTRLAVVGGAAATGDRLYVAAWAERGFFRGDQNGGSWTWTQAGVDLEWSPGAGNYGFSLAVDPNDPQDVLLGTIGGGLFRTTDGGASFVPVDGGFLATDGLGFAVDPSNPSRMLVSSTEGFDGTPGIYETLDGGANWQVLPIETDAMRLWISPLDPKVILAATVDTGLLRSADGGQTWTLVLTSVAQELDVWQLRDHPTPGWVLAAIAPNEGSTDPGGGLYLSQDEGATWSRLSAQMATSVAVSAANPSLMLLGGFGLQVSTDAGSSWTTAAGFVGKVLLTVALDPHLPGGLYAGGLDGDVWRSEDLGQSATLLSTGTTDSFITAILPDPDRAGGVWVANCGVDTAITPQTTYGLLHSSDSGTTWESYDEGLFPGRVIWSLRFVPGDTSQLLAGMWGGGGVWRLRLMRR
jgi:photosystem II stability/assembly factor-like uncharacterized protein